MALASYDESEVPFDLLVTVPLNMGADLVKRSGPGNELSYALLTPEGDPTLVSQ